MNPSDNQVVRVRLDETDDSGKQQRMRTRGRKNEQLGGDKHKMVRVQDYGRSSNPPKGSQGITIIIGSNPEQAFIVGIEHPDHRPTGLAEGETQMYDDQGQIIHIMRDKILIKSPKPIHIETEQDCIIKTDGVCHINPP